ncbi:ribulose-phosphate 3-epimerase [Rufibacter sediminis]|uniref:Ribulose-phosphate 3-epimerase n=1 Tax=Rufibacter sediminis TaxID=2762756 RepID=A0ABR6VRG8_9BACT|nr:ribulose-phosphate 3-epimerase [Rufibacter sediminis]MBC3539741.1 ribulose-phosphate 3-epimerase [Rufibacter sediminis]
MPHLIAPSVLAANFGQLDHAIEMLNQSATDWIHVDVMDGRFVPNISFGFPVLHAIQKVAQKPLDVHLMIEHPELYIEQFRAGGAEIITVHYEACPHLHRTLQQIKACGAKAGVALNPHTPVSFLSEVIQDIDVVCLMSVNPGFGGQKFIPHTYQKIKELKTMIQEKGSACLIEIDGGVNLENAPLLLSAGADVLVAGSFVFNSPNPVQTISDLKQLSF